MGGHQLAVGLLVQIADRRAVDSGGLLLQFLLINSVLHTVPLEGLVEIPVRDSRVIGKPEPLLILVVAQICETLQVSFQVGDLIVLAVIKSDGHGVPILLIQLLPGKISSGIIGNIGNHQRHDILLVQRAVVIQRLQEKIHML